MDWVVSKTSTSYQGTVVLGYNSKQEQKESVFLAYMCCFQCSLPVSSFEPLRMEHRLLFRFDAVNWIHNTPPTWHPSSIFEKNGLERKKLYQTCTVFPFFSVTDVLVIWCWNRSPVAHLTRTGDEHYTESNTSWKADSSAAYYSEYSVESEMLFK